MKEIKKKGKLYVRPLSVMVCMSESYCLLTGSKTVHGDHESADDDESYAKPNNWDWQDNCKNGWDD